MMKKIFLIIPLLSISLLFSQQREEIIERHSNGVKKLIFVYKGKGSKERLVRKLEYYDNEEIKSSTYWEKGKENGKYTSWHPNGQKFKEGTYKDGAFNKRWVSWDNNGEKKEELTFDNGKLIETDFTFFLNKKLPCTDDLIMISIIDIDNKKYFIPYDESDYVSIEIWQSMVQNLFDAGASHIIFNSDIPNISELYMDIEKNYNNIYRIVEKNKLNKFQFDCSIKIDNDKFLWLGLGFPRYSFHHILDTENINWNDEDVDWMNQFIPSEIPEWIQAIEDEGERKEIMEALGVGDYFDITQSPFYNNVILIGF